MNAFRRATSQYRLRGLSVLTVTFVCLMTAGQASCGAGCDRSPIKFAMPETESSCSISTTNEADLAALGSSPEAEAVKTLGTAFAPLDADAYKVTFTSYGKK